MLHHFLMRYVGSLKKVQSKHLSADNTTLLTTAEQEEESEYCTHYLDISRIFSHHIKIFITNFSLQLKRQTSNVHFLHLLILSSYLSIALKDLVSI